MAKKHKIIELDNQTCIIDRTIIRFPKGTHNISNDKDLAALIQTAEDEFSIRFNPSDDYMHWPVNELIQADDPKTFIMGLSYVSNLPAAAKDKIRSALNELRK